MQKNKNKIKETKIIEKELKKKKESLKFDKQARKQIIQTGKKLIENLSKKLANFEKNNKNTKKINYKIYYLLLDPFTFINAYTKISKNAGALSKGYEDDNFMQMFGLSKALTIVKKMKKNDYKFKPVKRTWIPKPGKKKKRPIDVPTQSDRIVQEAIRGILEAIYEPIFQEFEKKTKLLCSNCGFRPGLSCWTAIDRINTYSKPCNISIEGDIVSAYNSVNHDILLNILSQRIKDKRFLKLIKDMLKSGIMDDTRYEHSLEGTPQGGIVSPLLFNIYMFEFDKFIYEKFIFPIHEIENPTKPKIPKDNPAYTKKRNEIKNILSEMSLLRPIKKAVSQQNRTKYRILKKKLKKVIMERNKLPSKKVESLKKGAFYVRYADDWVLNVTSTTEEAKQMKVIISEFLEHELKLSLDKEKTKITQISKGYSFLGFKIRKRTSNHRVKFVTKKTGKGYSRTRIRTTSRLLTILPDNEKVLKRLKLNEFCYKDYMPIAKKQWINLSEFEIVEKFSQIMRGMFNYYSNCNFQRTLNHVSYILQYSCAKTLARRKKRSISQIFNLYSKDLLITNEIKTSERTIIRKVKFPTLVMLKKEAQQNTTKKVASHPETDPFRIRCGWRTKYKIYNECCICGSEDQIELHHINSLRNIKREKRDSAAGLRMSTKRLQIPVCKACHQDITFGRYKDPKKPIDYYNEFLAKL